MIRLERKQQKLVQKGMNVEKQPSNSEAKTLEQFLNEIPEESKHKLKVWMVLGLSEVSWGLFLEIHLVY